MVNKLVVRIESVAGSCKLPGHDLEPLERLRPPLDLVVRLGDCARRSRAKVVALKNQGLHFALEGGVAALLHDDVLDLCLDFIGIDVPRLAAGRVERRPALLVHPRFGLRVHVVSRPALPVGEATTHVLAATLRTDEPQRGAAESPPAIPGVADPSPPDISGQVRGVLDRSGRRATLVTSQVPVDHWHDLIGDATFGDAIMDRLVHHAHRITLTGASLRRLSSTPTESSAEA